MPTNYSKFDFFERSLIIFVLASTTLLASCGGGGGGGGSAPTTSPSITSSQINFTIDPQWDVNSSQSSIYKTNEYNNQWGLEKIKAADAYAILSKNDKTIAGNGVKIAIVDSGALMTHQEIANNYNSTGNLDIVNKDSDPTDDYGHGTHVASTAAGVKDGVVMHGVAFNSSIVAFKVLDSSGNGSISDVALGIGYAISTGAKVINLSLGGPASTSIKNQIINAKNSDILTVIATGNYSASQPNYPALYANDNQLKGYIIAVGSVKSSNNISSFTNHCGTTKDYCLVAPGENIFGAYIGGSDYYAYDSGTSMATPHVSGAVAVLRAAWPHLSALQTSDILLKTATDLGATGTDEIYGRGLLNLEKAVQAQGQNILGYGASVASGGYELATTSLISDPIFGDAFSQNVAPQLQSAIFLDDYGRDYKAFLGNKISSRNQINYIGLESLFFNNIATEIIPLKINQNNNFNFKTTHYKDQKAKNQLGLKFIINDNSQDSLTNNQQGFSFNRQEEILGKNVNWGLSFNIDEVSNLQNFNLDFNSSLLSTNFNSANPYQNFLRQNNGSNSNENVRNFRQFYINKSFFDKNLDLNFSYQASYDSNQFTQKINDKQNQVSSLGVNYKFKDQHRFSLSFGSLEEFENNILNSKSHGAFESKDNVKTSFIKLTSNHDLSKNVTLLFSYSEGLTKIQGNQQGIFRNFSNLRSRSSVIALNIDEFFNGKIGFIYLQPLRIYSGKVDYDIAVARDNAGNLIRQTGTSSLKPKGKEQNFEVFYLKNITNDSNIKFNFLLQKEANNFKDQPTNYLGAIVLSKSF